MISLGSSGGGGDSSWLFGWILIASIILLTSPLAMITFLPDRATGDDWSTEVASIEDTYLNMTGSRSTSEMNIWTLKGVYTPYDGNNVGYTEDGWIYGERVVNVSPSQYDASHTAGISNTSLSIRQADNGLWYYTSAPSYRTDIVTAQWGGASNNTVQNPDKATVCSMVVFDEDHVSDTFFTTSSKRTEGSNYYYAFTGYRYVYGPLSDYYINVGGQAVEVKNTSTSLSLIWYKYTTYSGISGQLTISGSDTGLSYLTSDDIIREFNSHNYSSTFDMQFNGVTMHLIIYLDPMYLQSMSVADAYNNGYWSVMVYSDAVASDMVSQTFDLSIENIVSTVIDIFTFNLGERYDVDGWMAFLYSLFFSLIFYSVALVVCLHNGMLLIGLGVLVAIQTIVSVISGGFGGLHIL